MSSIGFNNTEIIDSRILDVLEVAKNLKSEYVLIPRLLFQKTPSSTILGMSYDAVVAILNAEAFKNEKYYELWKENSLPWISLEGKSINQFNLEHKSLFPNTSIDKLQIEYTTYVVNGSPLSIGTNMTEYKEEADSTPSITLFSHDPILAKTESMLFAYQNSSFVVQNIDITNDEEFQRIANAKAGIGAELWVPKIGNLTDEEAHRYTMSLTGTLLNISKADKVFITIKDRLAGRTGYNFIVRFDVMKPKKGISISYYMMMLKVV